MSWSVWSKAAAGSARWQEWRTELTVSGGKRRLLDDGCWLTAASATRCSNRNWKHVGKTRANKEADKPTSEVLTFGCS